MNWNLLFAQANEASGDGDGSAVLGFFVIVGFLWAIHAACTKKKEYDVNLSGKIKQR